MKALICPYCTAKIAIQKANGDTITCPYCDSLLNIPQEVSLSKKATEQSDSQPNLKQAVKDFKKAWKKGNNEFYIISSAFYQLASLTNEPEIQTIEKNLNALEHKYQKFEKLNNAKKYAVSHIRAFLLIMIGAFLAIEFITGRLGDRGNDGFLALIALLIFTGVIGTIALVFRTWNVEMRLKSGNLPEKKAITEAIDSLFKKAERITDDKK